MKATKTKKPATVRVLWRAIKTVNVSMRRDEPAAYVTFEPCHISPRAERPGVMLTAIREGLGNLCELSGSVPVVEPKP